MEEDIPYVGDFQEYYGKSVRLVIDGRGFSVGSSFDSKANVSLELTAKPVNENERFLDLEDVCFHNNRFLEGLTIGRGKLNKDYIIGVFEPITKKE